MPARSKASKPDLVVEPAFQAVVAAFAKDRTVTGGKMMASFGLKVGGKIFAMMVRGRFVAKLPAERVNELVATKVGAYFEPRGDGRLMKEWISIAGHEERWVALAREARRFVERGT